MSQRAVLAAGAVAAAAAWLIRRTKQGDEKRERAGSIAYDHDDTLFRVMRADALAAAVELEAHRAVQRDLDRLETAALLHFHSRPDLGGPSGRAAGLDARAEGGRRGGRERCGGGHSRRGEETPALEARHRRDVGPASVRWRGGVLVVTCNSSQRLLLFSAIS